MAKDDDVYRNTPTSLPLLDRVKAVLDTLGRDPEYSGWDTEIMRGVQVEDVQPGKIIFTTTITPAMCNKADNLHGGCASTLLDNLTSFSLATIAKEGYLDGGSVSRTLYLTFLRPVPVETKVRVVCEAVSGGRNLAHCKGHIELLDGKVAVTCAHDKAVLKRGKL